MYSLLLLLSYIGIKPRGLRQSLRQHYSNHERGHSNLVAHHRRLARKANTSLCEAEHMTKARHHAVEASKLRERIGKLI